MWVFLAGTGIRFDTVIIINDIISVKMKCRLKNKRISKRPKKYLKKTKNDNKTFK